MGETTEISWTHSTFNPWTGCAKVSPGCANCYAETQANRFGKEVWGVDAPRERRTEAYWRQPLKWNEKAKASGKPWRIFCASQSDVFEDRRDLDADRSRLFALIEATPALTWLLLTKRPENVRFLAPPRWLPGAVKASGDKWPENVWLGTTVEDQKRADERISHLLRVPARVRFLSCEPLLDAVDLWPFFSRADASGELSSPRCNPDGSPAISWVIVGGESGPKARPMHPAWARLLRNQCKEAGVAFHFKQGSGHGLPNGRPAKPALLDGVSYRQFPEVANG